MMRLQTGGDGGWKSEPENRIIPHKVLHASSG
jgi:hypothetical protein